MPGRRRAWLIGAALLVVAAVAVVIVPHALSLAPPSSGAAQPVHFRTLPPGAKLPSGAQCARWVHASPSSESRPANSSFNHTVGHYVRLSFFPAGDSPQTKNLAPLITGDFTGTTQQILQWAACKWGIDQNIVFAQAAVESWWRQDELGDWGTDAQLCPPGHGLGADGRAGECPQSYGILQNKYPVEKTTWPGISTSTAMNVDAAYAIWRSCYDGYELWLNNQPRGQKYRAGDLWGCVGRWFAGSWHTAAADGYIHRVLAFAREQIWRQPRFLQSG